MKKYAIALLAAGVVAACSPPPDSLPLVQPGTETGVITIVNNQSRPIRSLNLGRCESNWRPDRLNGSFIEVGQSRDLTVSTGCYEGLVELGRNSITSTYQGLGRAVITAGETAVIVVAPR